MIEQHPRFMRFLGGPYDGAEQCLHPVVEEPDGVARLTHLTACALHHYESVVPLGWLGLADIVEMQHDPDFITPRRQ